MVPKARKPSEHMLNRGQGREARPLLSHSQQGGPAQHRDLEKTPWKDACEPSWWGTPERTPGPLPACWEAGKSWMKENKTGSQSRRRRPAGIQEAADPTRWRSENTILDSPYRHGWEHLCDGADVALAVIGLYGKGWQPRDRVVVPYAPGPDGKTPARNPTGRSCTSAGILQTPEALEKLELGVCKS